MNTTNETLNPMFNVLHEVAHSGARLIAFDTNSSADEKLMELGIGIGLLGQAVRSGCRDTQKATLIRIAAHCIGWVESNPSPIKDVFSAVIAERERQEGFLREGRFNFTCASRIADPKRKLRVVLEEVGEVAKECDQLEQTPKSRKVWPFLREELIHVAAVAVAWLESYEVAS